MITFNKGLEEAGIGNLVRLHQLTLKKDVNGEDENGQLRCGFHESRLPLMDAGCPSVTSPKWLL